MDNVVSFPGLNERNWHKLEQVLRDGLRAKGLPAEMVDWIVTDVKPRLVGAKMAGRLGPFEITAPAGREAEMTKAMQAVIADCENYFRQVTNALAEQILILEAALYMATFSARGTAPEAVKMPDRMFDVIRGGKGNEP